MKNWFSRLLFVGVTSGIGCGGDGDVGTSQANGYDAEAGGPESSLDAADEGAADNNLADSQASDADGAVDTLSDSADTSSDSADTSSDSADTSSDSEVACIDPQWRDVVSGACRTCPAPGISCASLRASGKISYNPATRVISLDVGPGRVEIISGLVASSDCIGLITLRTDDLAPNGNVLASPLPLGVSGSFCIELKYSVVDRCGDTYKFMIPVFYDQNQHTTVIWPCPDAGDAAVDSH